MKCHIASQVRRRTVTPGVTNWRWTMCLACPLLLLLFWSQFNRGVDGMGSVDGGNNFQWWSIIGKRDFSPWLWDAGWLTGWTVAWTVAWAGKELANSFVRSFVNLRYSWVLYFAPWIPETSLEHQQRCSPHHSALARLLALALTPPHRTARRIVMMMMMMLMVSPLIYLVNLLLLLLMLVAIINDPYMLPHPSWCVSGFRCCSRYLLYCHPINNWASTPKLRQMTVYPGDGFKTQGNESEWVNCWFSTEWLLLLWPWWLRRGWIAGVVFNAAV